MTLLVFWCLVLVSYLSACCVVLCTPDGLLAHRWMCYLLLIYLSLMLMITYRMLNLFVSLLTSLGCLSVGEPTETPLVLVLSACCVRLMSWTLLVM